jgi:hypothetical protein
MIPQYLMTSPVEISYLVPGQVDRYNLPVRDESSIRREVVLAY